MLPVHRLIAKIQSTMYRFPSIDIRSISDQQPVVLQLTFRIVSGFKVISLPPPILSTSSNEYRFPSIDIRNRSQEKHGSSRRFRARHLSHNARPAFAFLQVFPTLSPPFGFHNTLAPTYGDAPTQCFDDLSTTKIHSPPAFPFGARSFRLSSLQSVAKHLLLRTCNSRTISTEPADCWPLLAIHLEHTSLSLPSGLTEITARRMARDAMLGSANELFRSISCDPLRDHLKLEH